MKKLFNGKFEPTTFSIGFIEKPLPILADYFIEWTKKNHRNIECIPLTRELKKTLTELQPLSMLGRRRLLVATASSWTAYFDSGIRGSDPGAPVPYLSKILSCRGLIVTCTPNTLDTAYDKKEGTYGAIMFQLFADSPREFLNLERSIYAMNDGGTWDFTVRGTVQPFEEVEHYSAKKIADRFTPDMLQRYCEALGVRVFDEDFYLPSSVLIDIKDPPPEGLKQMSLREARQSLGLPVEQS